MNCYDDLDNLTFNRESLERESRPTHPLGLSLNIALDTRRLTLTFKLGVDDALKS